MAVARERFLGEYPQYSGHPAVIDARLAEAEIEIDRRKYRDEDEADMAVMLQAAAWLAEDPFAREIGLEPGGTGSINDYELRLATLRRRKANCNRPY